MSLEPAGHHRVCTGCEWKVLKTKRQQKDFTLTPSYNIQSVQTTKIYYQVKEKQRDFTIVRVDLMSPVICAGYSHTHECLDRGGRVFGS